MWKGFILLLLLAFDGFSSQRTVGQWCFSKSGNKGVCRLIRDCSTGIAMVKIGVLPEICSFQGKTAVICCEDRPHRTTTDISSKWPNEDALPVVYPSENTYTEKPVHHFTYPYPYPSSSEIHGGSKNNPMQTNEGPIYSYSNQRRPNQGNIYSNSNQKHHNHGQIHSNHQQTNQEHISSNQNNYFDAHNQLGASQNHNTQGTVASSFSSQTNTPVKRRISEEKCEEYSKRITSTLIGLPITLNPDPVTVTVAKCDFEQLPLIVGGEKTLPGEFPHMAAIGFPDGRNLAWNCGGSLISDLFVLTAAHCTYSSKGNPVVVRLGENNLKSDNDGAHPVDYTIKDIIRHPNYNPPEKYNDIALLKLDRKVQFNNFIRPACLYSKEYFTVNKTIATGWGRVEYAEKPSDILLKVTLDIVSNEECNKLWHTSRKQNILARGITSSMMCAGALTGGRDTCQGDSGGPIQIQSKKNQCMYYIVGVTSFGKYCAARNTPGVYSRVSEFVSWIETIIW